MCEHCEKGLPMFESKAKRAKMEIRRSLSGRWVIAAVQKDGVMHVYADFCPKCGRDLRGGGHD